MNYGNDAMKERFHKMARQNVATKRFINRDESEVSHASSEAVAVKFAFTNGAEIVIDPKDLPKNVRDAALMHGLSQKVGDAYAGSANADGDPIAWAHEKAETVVANMMAGLWVTQREAGAPRVSMLLAAFKETVEAAGKVFDEAKMQAKLVDEKTGAAFRKQVLANAAVKAVYDRMRREAAEAREAVSATAAEGVTIDDLL